MLYIETLEDYTPKTVLAKKLNISLSQLKRYHEIAMYLDDFTEDYPEDYIDETPITSAPLTKYQCWVLLRIQMLSRYIGLKKLIKVDGWCLHQEVVMNLSKQKFNHDRHQYQTNNNPKYLVLAAN